MRTCTNKLVWWIFLFLKANTTWLMPVLASATHCWFLIVVYGITWLNGDELLSGTCLKNYCVSVKLTVSDSPATREELFNLRHASARNIVERIFGVVKRRWRILTSAPEYDLGIQAQIVPGLAAIHNFILKHDPFDLMEYDTAVDREPGVSREDLDLGELSTGPADDVEKTRAELRRDAIAQAMWEDYQKVLEDRELLD